MCVNIGIIEAAKDGSVGVFLSSLYTHSYCTIVCTHRRQPT